jgi:23S rRNA U2552 (ribose-2'-O)-methylase RlmE/FtsJ
MKIVAAYQNAPNSRIQNDTFVKLWQMREKVGEIIKTTPREWRQALNTRDCTKNVGKQHHCINRAYFKCAELCELVTVSPRVIVHLCEAPGGFAEFCCSRYPGAQRASFSLESKGSIAFAPTVTCAQTELPNDGDICNRNVLNHIKAIFPDGVDLVTGDGGIAVERIDIEEQECTKLFFSQVMATLAIQRVGGSCFIKFFEGATKTTIDIVKAMHLFYERVEVTKPRTSRGSNSERYMVCNGFHHNDAAMQAFYDIYNKLLDNSYLSAVVDEDLTPSDLRPFEELANKQIKCIELLITSIESKNFDKIVAERKEDEKIVLKMLQQQIEKS